MRDLEYLIQLYPERAEKYLRTISHMLDHLDYRGSLIYDEYPDRLALFRLVDSVEEQIRREEAPAALAEPQEAGGLIKREGESGAETQDRKVLVQILLYYEIFRRRRKIRQNAVLIMLFPASEQVPTNIIGFKYLAGDLPFADSIIMSYTI